MMSVLFIGPEDFTRIDEAIAAARANPVSLDAVKASAMTPGKFELKLEDRPKGFDRPQSHHVEFTGGVRASISFERQPNGLCRHLSISAPTPGALPNLILVKFLCERFGFRTSPGNGAMFWLEEFEPGHSAVNVIELAQEN